MAGRTGEEQLEMPRKIRGEVPCRPPGAMPWSDYTERSYELDLITPMVGGGPETGKRDPITLIRPSSIRGQLRFWWRATRGAHFTTVRELRSREAAIWGDINNPSPVIVEVSAPIWEKTRRPPTYELARYGPEAYALFSAKQNSDDLCREGLQFTLTLRILKFHRLQEFRDRENERRRRTGESELLLSIQDILQDVEAAVWAWANFGGLGARTRRGCGALSCQALAPPNRDAIERWLSGYRRIFSFQDSQQKALWPTVARSIFVGPKTTTPVEAWKHVLELLQRFRQGEYVGRNPGKKDDRGRKKPGQSRWPEPETIRRITGQRCHPRLPAIPEDAFPRAVLGLPIIFWFKDEGLGDPKKTELFPYFDGEARARMASPLILRPLALTSGEAVPIILAFDGPLPEAVGLKYTGSSNGEPLKRLEAPVYYRDLGSPPTPIRRWDRNTEVACPALRRDLP